jgi:hypothetical protein
MNSRSQLARADVESALLRLRPRSRLGDRKLSSSGSTVLESPSMSRNCHSVNLEVME